MLRKFFASSSSCSHCQVLIESTAVPFSSLICRRQSSSSSSSTTTTTTTTTNENISSFLHRLLSTAKDFSDFSGAAAGVFDTWISKSTSIENIFSNTEVRFHSVRVPVQRDIARMKALKRQGIHHDGGNEFDKSSSASKHDQQDENEVTDTTVRSSSSSSSRSPSPLPITVIDPTHTVKSISQKDTELVSQKMKMFNLRSKRKQPSENNNNNDNDNNNKLPGKLLLRACRDMREDRFCEYLKTTAERVRRRSGGLQADKFAGVLCRYWLNARQSSGLSFPSTESAYSPLLPTMLFFSAARDPELFKDLVRRIDRERGRFSSAAMSNHNNTYNSSSSGGNENGASNSSASLNRYGIATFASSPMVGWIAAVAVTMETALPIARENPKNSLKQKEEDREKAMKKKKMMMMMKEEEISLLSSDDHGDGGQGKGDDDDHDEFEQDASIGEGKGKNEGDSAATNRNIVDIASKKLQDLLVDERCFSVSAPKDAIKAVLPVVLSTLLNPVAGSSLFVTGKQHLPPLSIVTFVPGTKQSVCTFELWNRFARKFLLARRGGGDRDHRGPPSAALSSNSCLNQRVLSSLALPIPPYFAAFLLQTAQQQADTFLSGSGMLNPSVGRTTPTSASMVAARNALGSYLMDVNGTACGSNVSSCLDEIVSLVIGTFCRTLGDCARLCRHGNGSPSPATAAASWPSAEPTSTTRVGFALYVRLLRTLSSCGCASWVMESVVKDCLAVVHPHTCTFLCHVVVTSLQHHKMRQVLASATKTEEEIQLKWSRDLIIGCSSASTQGGTDDEDLVDDRRRRTSQQFQKETIVASSNFSALQQKSLICRDSQANFLLVHLSPRHFPLASAATITSQQQQHQQQQQQIVVLPVDHVAAPISDDMWNTAVEACAIVAQSGTSATSSSEENRNGADDGAEAPAKPNLPRSLLLQLAITRIRGACLELVRCPERIHELVQILKRSSDAAVATSATASESRQPFEDFIVTAPSVQRAEMNQEEVDESAMSPASSLWCDPVQVLSKWLSCSPSSPLEFFASNNRLRLQAITSVFAALADISVFVPSPFWDDKELRRNLLHRHMIARSAAEALDLITANLVKSGGAEQLVHGHDVDDKAVESSTGSHGKYKKRLPIDFEEFIPSYWVTVCSIASTTRDVIWLHHQYLFMIQEGAAGSHSPTTSSVALGIRILSRHFTAEILKMTCSVITDCFGISTSIHSAFNNSIGINNNNNNNIRQQKNSDDAGDEQQQRKRHCVALNKLLLRVCRMSGYTYQQQPSSPSTNFIQALVESDPDVHFCLRRKKHTSSDFLMRGTPSFADDENVENNFDSSARWYYQKERMNHHHHHHHYHHSSPHSLKNSDNVNSLHQQHHRSLTKRELATAYGSSSNSASRQFATAVETTHGRMTHRQTSCSPIVHPSTHHSLQVALQAMAPVGSVGAAGFNNDLSQSKRYGWQTSGIHRSVHQDKQQSDEGESEANSETLSDEDEEALCRRECLTDIIEGFAVE